jgi:signal peptidase I
MQQDPIVPTPVPNTTPGPVTPVQPPETDIVTGEGTSQRSGLRNILSTVGILLAAPLIAVALTAFVFQSYEVDGPSMETTLQNHDRLIVWKIPRTISRITHHDYIPNRGDVVIFVRHDLFEDGGNEKQLIKRVVALPGERVVVANGKITVYNKENPNGFNPDENQEFTANLAKPTIGDTDIVVPPGEVFVCGDNRVNSLDSRSFGTVPSHDLVGRMVLRIYPPKGFRSYI